jgi:hypothetical protein
VVWQNYLDWLVPIKAASLTRLTVPKLICMTELLEQAISKLKTRSIRQQNEIAAMILEEIKRLEQKTQSIETKTDRS